jgi:hypothetical protein
VAASVAFFAIGHFAGASQNEQAFLKARSISARKLEIRRADNKVAARLAEDRNGANRLTFFDNKGRARLELGLSQDGAPSILLLGEDMRQKIGISMGEATEAPTVFLCDDSGNHAISLTVHKGLGPSLVVGAPGRAGVSMGASPDGSAFVDLADKTNRARVTLSVDNEVAGLSIMDSDHLIRASLRVVKDGRPAFSLYDVKQRERLIVATDADGKPSIRIVDPDTNSEKVLAIDR